MLRLLCRAAAEVGERLLRLRESGGSAGHWEGTQFKAVADRAAHDAWSRALAELLPGVPVLSEEDPESLTTARPRRHWLIDPLDGTASYAHGYHGYVTQAALMEGGRPVLAAVYAPESREMFGAEAGHGAWLGDRRLRITPGGSAPVLIDNHPEPRGTTAEIHARFRCGGYVESGSIGLKLCRIADGTAQLFVKDLPVRDWDLAAPHLVLAEAGGTLTGLRGEDFAYRDGYEHPGLIAADGPVRAAAVTAWFAARLNGRSADSPLL